MKLFFISIGIIFALIVTVIMYACLIVSGDNRRN